MQTVKTDQTVRMRRVIWVFAGLSGHFVGFVVLRLIFTYIMGISLQTSNMFLDRENISAAKLKTNLAPLFPWAESWIMLCFS